MHFTKNYVAVCSIFILLVSSCSKNKHNETSMPITVDINLADNKLIPIDKSKLLQLETNDSSLIYDICALAYGKDTLIIQSRNFVKAFDSHDGKYLYHISRVGQGPGEYTGIMHFWNNNDTICLLNSGTSDVLMFNVDGSFIGKKIRGSEIGYGSSFVYIVDAPDKRGYYIINCYRGGTSENNPKYSFYSLQTHETTDLPGCELLDGSFTPDRMITDFENNRVLSWDQLRDTLYVINPDGQRPLYAFDFGKNSFPSDIQAIPQFHLRVQEYTKNKSETPYASFIKYYQPKGDNLYFSFMTSDAKAFLAEYNEKSRKITTFCLYDPTDRYAQAPFFKIDEDNLIVAMTDKNDTEANPSLYTLPIKDIPR